jgi:hypothetical protein
MFRVSGISRTYMLRMTLLLMTMFKFRQHRCQRGAVVQSLTWLATDRPGWAKRDIHDFFSSLSRPVFVEVSLQHQAAEMWSWTPNLNQYVRNLTSTATKNLHNFFSKGVMLAISASHLAGNFALLFPVNSEFVSGNFWCTFTNNARKII